MESIRQGTVDVLTLVEALTGDVAIALEKKLGFFAEQGVPRVVINMQQVPVLDSSALEFLLTAKEDYERRGGNLKLVSPSALCRHILEITGLDLQFEILADNKTAVGSFAR
jgi:anti-anti-sigma factor